MKGYKCIDTKLFSYKFTDTFGKYINDTLMMNFLKLFDCILGSSYWKFKQQFFMVNLL